MGRKDKTARNIGGQVPTEVPDLSTARDSIVMVERFLRSLLQTTTDRLKDATDPQAVSDLTRFFSHFFDPTLSEAERNDFIKNFQTYPPKALLGYPRSTAVFPCFSIILEGENEDTGLMGDFMGETTPDEEVDEFQEYVGSFYDSTYGIYIYAEHPDVCAYLYQYAKSVVHGGKALLLSCGVQKVVLSGGELAPDETYMPENMFMRVLRVNVVAPTTVPVLTAADLRKVRITGIFRSDVVVDGVPSGVKEIPASEMEDGAITKE